MDAGDYRTTILQTTHDSKCFPQSFALYLLMLGALPMVSCTQSEGALPPREQLVEHRFVPSVLGRASNAATRQERHRLDLEISGLVRNQVAAAPAEVRAPSAPIPPEPTVAEAYVEASNKRAPQHSKRPFPPGPVLENAIRKHPHCRLIRGLYQRLGGELLFHRDGVLTGTGESVLGLLHDVPSHGLSREDYGVDSISNARLDSQEAVATRDVALAYGVLRYVGDFQFAQWAHPLKPTRSWAVLLERHQAGMIKAAAGLFPSVDVGLKGLWPSDPLYEAARKALPEYTERMPGWRDQPRLSWRWKNFEPGDRHSLIGQYQRRLAFDGYYDGPFNSTLDERTAEAVRAFQREHGMVPDGKPGKTTNWRMTTTRKDRVNQLRATLFHLRELPSRRANATTYIRVNVAGADMQMYEQGRLVREHKVVVGNNDIEGNRQKWRQGHLNRTPLMRTKLYEVVLNPVWIVPKRIKSGEFASKTSDYLQSKGIHTKGDVLVQSAGRHNVLGQVKFLLERTNAVYMHDTNRRHLFETDDRYRSHGCMRVSDALELARHLLVRSGQMTAGEFEAALAEGKTKPVPLAQPIDVFVEYVATGIDGQGQVVFHPDVYGYDRAFARGKLPSHSSARWGSSAMRPRNVPRIPFRQFESLYAAGGLAPLSWPPKATD